jgi:hypothetical protein
MEIWAAINWQKWEQNLDIFIYLCEIQGYNLNHCVQLSSLSVETKSLYNISNFLFRRPQTIKLPTQRNVQRFLTR